jgi:5-methylcytosine-specific restriction endonuclease McrA
MVMFNKKEYMKQYRQKNKGRIAEYSKQWRLKNSIYMKEYLKNYSPEKKKESNKQWYEKNREKILERQRQNYHNNPEKERERRKRKYWKHKGERNEYRNQWIKDKRKIDLKFNLNIKMSSAIHNSLKGNKNGRHWETLVGYTLNDLIKHLKKAMPEGYNWQDFLEGKLHIDHIIPKSIFNFDSPEQIDFQRCWTLENLRLLPARENLRKHNKLLKPFQTALKI